MAMRRWARPDQLIGEGSKVVVHLSSRWPLLDPDNAPIPADGGDLIPDLLVLPGYRCVSCAYMSISCGVMQAHCRQRHPGTSKQDTMWHGVYLQTFMT